MSPRAAWRLESLGFGEIYDYVAGKLDWMAAGLPTGGTNATLAEQILATAAQHGLRTALNRPGPVWQIAALERVAATRA